MTKTILVVDDLATQRAALFFALTGAGYDVLRAENGKSAIQQLKELNYVDLIISDLKMPEMDGINLIKQLKENKNWYKIPVLVLLMESQLNQKEELRQVGAAGWILKPFQPEQLCTVVSKLTP